MKRHRFGIALPLILAGILVLATLAMSTGNAQSARSTVGEGSKSEGSGIDISSEKPEAAEAAARHHYERRKHPAGTDRTRFVTTRQSSVSLPLPEDENAFSFIVFGDRTGGPPEGIAVLEQAVHDTNLIEPDLVMTVGDLINGYNATGQWLEQMREYKGVMSNLLCPWFPVPGNHDVYWRGAGRPEGEHDSNYEKHFGPLWYGFEHKGCWFIALYSDEGNPETGEKNFGKPECQRMSPEQYEWLKETLMKARDARHIFLFLHHPRWLGGRYGKDWERVHWLLSRAGNVSIVFAGHIHRMRYDGPRDGIEYVTLATVGGAQSSSVPRAGYLHQYHIVTVRDEQIAIASIPVGEAMDVRAITGDVSVEAGALSGVSPRFDTRPRIDEGGRASESLLVTVENPVQRAVSVTASVESGDARWLPAPGTITGAVQPGEARTFRFDLSRAGKAFDIDEGFRLPEMVLRMEYQGENLSVPIPESRTEIPLRLDLPAPARPAVETALHCDGDDCLAVPDSLLDLPDGPLTLECWFNAESYGDRTGLLCKTESSEYGLFVNKAQAEFHLFLDESYVTLTSGGPVLETGVWHHIAAVYDGEKIRLYIDGRLISDVKAKGKRRSNGFPLLVGADVSNRGAATSHFTGRIDEVRLSAEACYEGRSFKPSRRLEAGPKTMLMLHMDGMAGPWHHDASPFSAHARLRGDPEIVEVKD